MSNKKRTLIVRIICIIIVAIMVLGICVSARAYEAEEELSVSSEKKEEETCEAMSESEEVSEEEAVPMETEEAENVIASVFTDDPMVQTEPEMSITEAAALELVMEFEGAEEDTAMTEEEKTAAEAEMTEAAANTEALSTEEAEISAEEAGTREEETVPAEEAVIPEEETVPVEEAVIPEEETVPAEETEIPTEENELPAVSGEAEPEENQDVISEAGPITEAPTHPMLMMLPGIDIIGGGTEKTKDEPSAEAEPEKENPEKKQETEPSPAAPDEKGDSGSTGTDTPEQSGETRENKDINGRDIPNTGDSNSGMLYIVCMSASFAVMLFASYLIILNKRNMKKAAYAREREEFRRKFNHKS